MEARKKFSVGDWVETLDKGYSSIIPYGTKGIVVGFSRSDEGEPDDGEGKDLVILDFGPDLQENFVSLSEGEGTTFSHKFIKNISRVDSSNPGEELDNFTFEIEDKYQIEISVKSKN